MMVVIMALRRVIPFAIVGLVAACSNDESSLNPQPLPPQDERSPNAGSSTGGSTSSGGSQNGSFGSCSGTCCNKPAAGSACDTTADTTCSWAIECPSGLVLPYEITCTSGTWQLTNGCPAEGQVDARGCPGTQPVDGSACDPSTVTQQCGYVLPCNGYRKTMLATCGGDNKWTSPPLGKCD